MRTQPIARRIAIAGATFVLVSLLASGTLRAQQISGVPGSPDATVTLEGKQLPPPPMEFGGVINQTAGGFHSLTGRPA